MNIKLTRLIRTFFPVLVWMGLGVGFMLSSCSTTSDLEPGQMEIKKVVVVSDNPTIDTKTLSTFVHQRPGLYEGKKKHLAFDTLKTKLSCRDLTSALANEGYLHATVNSSVYVRPKTAKRVNPDCEVTYFLHPNEPFSVRNINYDIQDQYIDSLVQSSDSIIGSHLKVGRQFSVSNLNEERLALTKYLQNNGFYKFNKEFVRFVADTIAGEHSVDLTLKVMPYRASRLAPDSLHPVYNIRNITYRSLDNEPRLPVRQSVLDECTFLKKGGLYSADDYSNTYQHFSRLQALRYTNIHFVELPDSVMRNTLDCDIVLAPRKPNSISFQPEGTNTAGDLGAAVSLAYENRNLFHGSESFTVQLRGAYEAITGLEGYNNKDYVEYGIESKLQFPRFIVPFLGNRVKRNTTSTSELSVAYNMQNRPEFHRRVFSAAWRYKWSVPRKKVSYKLDVLDLNYIYMPWISETFKHDYLDSVSNRNAILRYNYEDLFVMKIGLGVAFNSGTNAWKLNIESAGNLLNGISRVCRFGKNDENQYTLFNIAYAQYVKGDIDFTHVFPIAPKKQFVVHGGLGIAYPYGNSSILPFEKRYFSGGANSVRGWSVRGLGPGSYSGTDGRIDFINQSGDIKLDLNLEYRTFLFWKIDGAAFIDAGNIWTIREYESQPGGQFRFDEFYRQIAVAYGLGLRVNFGYFVLRFDAGMKAIDPACPKGREHYPVFHPDMKRDFAFHFAVGLPF